MTADIEIINLLLDRYERSGHCLPGKSSNRRVALAMSRGEYPPYRENDPSNIEVNHIIESLSKEGLVSYTWRKGYEGWLLDKVYLNLEELPSAYVKAGRVPLSETASGLRQLIQQYASQIKTPWKLQFLEDELSKLEKNLRPSRHLDSNNTEAVLKILEYTEYGPNLMRVISANCFHDSKYLERNLLSNLTSIAKAYEPELIAFRDAGEELLTQSVILEQIGILTYPEIFEFCGAARLALSNSVLDISPFHKGFCLQSENMNYISGLSFHRIKKVLFIENRTNYRDFLRQGFPNDWLIVWHGGFYSPTKKRLFQLFSDHLPASVEVRFWGDIDLGGFLMFTRLKQEIFHDLIPYRMGLEDYNQYKLYGLERKSSYLTLLQQHMKQKRFDAVFMPVAEEILRSKVTIEQEIMV